MIHNLRLCVVVLFRLVAFGLIATSVSLILMSSLFGGRSALLRGILSTAQLLVPAIILWVVAKPAARLMTSGLRDEP